jgi:hypothetical protein
MKNSVAVVLVVIVVLLSGVAGYFAGTTQTLISTQHSATTFNWKDFHNNGNSSLHYFGFGYHDANGCYFVS